MPQNLQNSPIFRLEIKNITANAQKQDDMFVVLKGSQALGDSQLTASYEKYVSGGYKRRRLELIEQGILQSQPGTGHYLFTQDVPFKGSSEALAVVAGKTDGPRDWFTFSKEGNKVYHVEWLRQQAPSLLSQMGLAPVKSVETNWQPFFHELALKVLEYEERQPELIQVLKTAGVNLPNDDGEELEVIDPFSFFAFILKQTSDRTAIPLFTKVGAMLGVQAPVPLDLMGVPWSIAMNAEFFAYRSKRQEGDIATLWNLARQTLQGQLQAQTFEDALKIRKVALSKLTQGLFWLNPQAFLALNSVNIPFLQRRGVRKPGKVKTLAEYHTILRAAEQLAPNFTSLSHAAWLSNQQESKVAQLVDGFFPFTQFCHDAAEYMDNKDKGNMVLEQRYSPLLVELFEEAAPNHLVPVQSAYGGGQQLAVKVSLGGGVKAESGVFGRALMFAEEGGVEYVRFPPGLTLEVGIPDGKGDGPRQVLQSEAMQEALLAALIKDLPLATPPTLTLNTDFGALQLLPLTSETETEITAMLMAYVAGTGKSRRLRIGLSILPEELESPHFLTLLEAAVDYVDDLTAALEPLARTPEVSKLQVEPIQAAGEAPLEEPAPLEFQPVPGVPLNQILYGPPGTGKTYNVVERTLAILDPGFLDSKPERKAMKARYEDFVAQGAVSFVTFHQSFGYEDFIEGIKPVMKDGQLSYVLEDGIFLEAVRAAGGNLPFPNGEKAPAKAPDVESRADGQVWRIYIDGTRGSRVRDQALERGEIRLGSWLQAPSIHGTGVGAAPPAPKDLTTLPDDELNSRQMLFRDAMRVGDLVFLATAKDRIGAVGVVTSDYRFDPHSDEVFASDYAHVRSVRWLAKNLSASTLDVTSNEFTPQALQRVNTVKPLEALQRMALHLPESRSQPSGLRPHVLIIDEINRGNVAKVFGELITLLESGKRAGKPEALTVKLPLSRRSLSIPQSLYVIGTMNTADRSLTQLDTALRRRFSFHEIPPLPSVLPVVTIEGNTLDLRKFLYAINARIERLLSREQLLGHAYLLDVPKSLEGVASALRERILPQLEEYFFDDWAKIHEVLADTDKDTNLQFIQAYKVGEETLYRVNEAAFSQLEAFTLVYSRLKDDAFPFEV